jgi:hypothetical protein
MWLHDTLTDSFMFWIICCVHSLIRAAFGTASIMGLRNTVFFIYKYTELSIFIEHSIGCYRSQRGNTINRCNWGGRDVINPNIALSVFSTQLAHTLPYTAYYTNIYTILYPHNTAIHSLLHKYTVYTILYPHNTAIHSLLYKYIHNLIPT